MPTFDEVRTELVRSRAFIRGAETQLSKTLEALDILISNSGGSETPDTEPTPDPETTAPSEVVFRSTWDTATGNSEPAIKDGDAWPEHFWCGGMLYEVLGVVEGSEVGWTKTPNVLRVRHTGVDGHCGAIQRREAVPASTTHWGRMYFRSGLQGWGGGMHNFSYNFVGDIQSVFFNPSGGSDDGFRVGFGFDYTADGTHWSSEPHPDWALGSWLLKTGPGNPTDPNATNGISDPNAVHLPHGEWIRYEWQVEYVTPTSFRFWPRIYDNDGALLYDADDFYPIWHHDQSLREWQEAGGSFGTSDPEFMRNIGIGNEGREGGSESEWWVADFAVSLDGWIGG